MESLKAEAEDNRQTVERLRGTTEQQMWEGDLDAVLEVCGGRGHSG